VAAGARDSGLIAKPETARDNVRYVGSSCVQESVRIPLEQRTESHDSRKAGLSRQGRETQKRSRYYNSLSLLRLHVAPPNVKHGDTPSAEHGIMPLDRGDVRSSQSCADRGLATKGSCGTAVHDG